MTQKWQTVDHLQLPQFAYKIMMVFRRLMSPAYFLKILAAEADHVKRMQLAVIRTVELFDDIWLTWLDEVQDFVNSYKKK